MKTEPIEARCHIMTRSFGNGYGDEIMLREDAEEAVNMAFKEGQSSPKIKQLEWVEGYGYIKAETPFSKYMVVIIGGKAGLCFDGNDEFLKFKTVVKAKAAAQADFEKRVMGCIISE